MVRQFAINTRRRRLSESTIFNLVNEDPHQCVSWMESTQYSKYRHESHVCQHSIVVLASVVDIKLSEKMCSIILCDSIGEKIITLLPSLKIDGTLISILKKFKTDVVMVLSFTNPVIFVETFPFHAEDSCKIFLLSSEESVQLIDFIPRGMTTFNRGVTECSRNSLLEMTIFLEQYIQMSSNINAFDQGGATVTNLHPEYLQSFDEKFSIHLPYHVRDILMYDIYPRQRIPLSCVVGMIRSVHFIPSTSSSHLWSSSQSNQKKLRMEYVEKFLIEFEDIHSCDQIKVYLPVTPATRSLCTSGMIIFLFHPFLKCSANFKSVYLECKIDEFSIGQFLFFTYHFTSLISLSSPPSSPSPHLP
jgi:hypothetical protein